MRVLGTSIFLIAFLTSSCSAEAAPVVILPTDVDIPIIIKIEPGFKVNAQAPSRVSFFELQKNNSSKLVKEFTQADLILTPDLRSPKLRMSSEYLLKAVIFVCRKEGASVCQRRSKELKIKALNNGNKQSQILLDFTSQETHSSRQSGRGSPQMDSSAAEGGPRS